MWASYHTWSSVFLITIVSFPISIHCCGRWFSFLLCYFWSILLRCSNIICFGLPSLVILTVYFEILESWEFWCLRKKLSVVFLVLIWSRFHTLKIFSCVKLSTLHFSIVYGIRQHSQILMHKGNNYWLWIICRLKKTFFFSTSVFILSNWLICLFGINANCNTDINPKWIIYSL